MSTQLLQSVIALVQRAGALIVREAALPNGPRGSGDKADVDVEVEVLLHEGLLRLLPCDFVGEETGMLLKGAEACWVVDPNDGTSDFLRTRKGSAISVGLLVAQEPVLGVIYAPLTPRGPDCIAGAQGAAGLWRNGARIKPGPPPNLAPERLVFVSAAAERQLALNDELCAPARCQPMPSVAYRLARVAAGDGVAAVSLYPVAPHDVVAGHALLRAIGGELCDHQGTVIGYDDGARFHRDVLGCFGGAVATCRELSARPWQRLVPSYSTVSR
ncbi:inositol monophosphatase family protein [Pseudomonas aeruginosa]